MRFRKRLSAAILAIVMMISSIQIPGGMSYAAEMADSSIESGQDVSVLTAEDTEDIEAEAETSENEGTITNEGSLTDNDNSTDGDKLTGDENPVGDNSLAGDENPAGDDSQTGDENPAGDDSQTGDENPTDDDAQTDDENVSEEETEAGLVSDDDAEAPDLSVDAEESEAEETEVVKAEIEGAYQFGDAPSASGEISIFSVSSYDKSVEDYVYQQMLKREKSIDLYAGGFYDVKESDVTNLVGGVINDHPDLYFVKKTYSYATSYGKITDLYMDYYTSSYDDAAFNRKVEAALACVTDEMSDDVKAIVLHDYLAINVEYDYDNLLANNIPTDSYTAYGALVNGIAVCNGYALAYQYLLNELGIECYMVTSSSMNHAWNLVKLNGEFYHVDVTWDDPVWDMVGRVNHNNMLRSDDNLEEHYSWTVTSGINTYNYKATNTKYENAFWVECSSPLVLDGTNCYYISDNEMSLKKASFSNISNTGTKIVGIDRWTYYQNGSAYGYWQGAFSGLYMINGRLFYNDENSIYSIKPDGTGKKTEFTPKKTNNNQIYYSAYRNGIVVYALHTNPNLTEKQTVLTAEIEGVEAPPQNEGLDIENSDYTFTTLDDQTVSSKAEGKPKVLIFLDIANPNCTQTIQDLSEHIEALGDVDIYAIESFYGSTKETVAEFKNTYGCDKITYCYDKEGKYRECLVGYLQKVVSGNSISLTTPFIVFIDSDNRVQHTTDGVKNWAEIFMALRKYCGYDYGDTEGIYNITYVLDGGTNANSNPTAYTAEMKTIELRDASKEGYNFEGWYTDSSYKQKVTEIPEGSIGDITLYAKWGKAGLNAENPNYTFTTLDDQTVSAKADGKPKVLIFFRPGCYYCQKTCQDLSKNIKNFSGVDVYAIEAFDGSSKAEVSNFKNTYGCDEITFCYDKDGMNGYYAWKYIDITHVSNGNSVTTPVIIFIDSENRVQYGTSGARTWNQILEDLQDYCGHVETYKITYKLNGGTNDSANPNSYTSETETITLKDAVKDGYAFDGWYKDAGFKEKITEIVNGSKGDITLYAKWKEIPVEPGTYRIIYELNGGTNGIGNPTSYTSETETITLNDPSKENFIFEGWYTDARFNKKVTEITKGSEGDITLYAKWKAVQVDIDPDTPGNIQTGIAVRFTDYYSLGENSIPCYKYTGVALKPAVDVYSNNKLLTLGTDYTLTYKNNTKVGIATLTVKGKGSYSGASGAVSFEIINADIRTDTSHPTKMTVIAGTKVTPIFMNGIKKLTTKDYKLEGDNFVGGKYAQPTGGTPNILTVTGIGSYAGSSFTIAVTVIDKKDAKKLAVTIDKSFKPVYDGSALDLDALFGSPTGKGSITVTDSKEKTKVLEKGKDFYVVCTSSLKAAGTVKFTVTGMGQYTGSVSKSFKISPLKVTDNAKFSITYDSKAYEYKASGTTLDNLTVKYLGNTTSEDDDKTLIAGEDYKVSYSSNKKVSTGTKKAQVKITFLGNYKGSKPVTKDFTISAAKLSMQTAGSQAVNTKVIVPDKVYDKAGKSYKSTPIVTVDGVSIKASNYNVSYAWAAVTYAGTEGKYEDGNKVKLTETDSYAKVKVKITLKGQNYALADGTTSIEGEYCVRRKEQGVTDLSKAKVTFRDKDGKPLKALEYNGKAYYTPEGNSSVQSDPNAVYVSVTVNGEPVDSSLYSVIWTDATAKGKATVVVTGKGTWAVGSKNQTISIKAMALKGKTIDYFKLN